MPLSSTKKVSKSLIGAFVFVLASAVTPCLAEADNKVFQWQFANNALSEQLATCLSYQIIVKPYNATLNTSQGIPPYYMVALPTGGTPTTTYLGSDNNSLSWQPTHPPATKLMLSVVDSAGSAGGIPPMLYTVIPGQSTQCVVNDTSRDFTVTANVTGSINTCQPWGLTIKGGIPPYNVTLAALDSPVVTNVTMPFGNDVFTYINRADPGSTLVAAVSDLSGRWAYGTPNVQTKGSSDYSCVGLVSSSGNSTTIKKQQEAADAEARSKRSKRIATIAGVCVAVGVLLVAAIVGIFWFIWRKRRLHVKSQDELKPRQFEGAGNHTLSLPNGSSLRLGGGSGNGKGGYGYAAGEYISVLPSSASSSTGAPPMTPGRTSDTNNNRNSNTGSTSRLSLTGRRSKGGEAGTSLTVGAQQRGSASSSAMPLRRLSPQAQMVEEVEPLTGDDIIIQHQDAGPRSGVVRELPPPYVDRSIPSLPE